MSQQLTRHLFRIMRGASRRQTLGNLRRQGIRRVLVLRVGELELMLEMAVKQALVSLGKELDEQVLDEMSSEVRAQFLALREERDSLRETVDELRRQRKELSRNRSILRQELNQAEAELADRGPHGRLDSQAEADLDTLRERLRGSLHALLVEPAGEDLAQQAVDVALTAVEAHRTALVARENVAQRARHEQLRRRIARLRARLAESEVLLARARAAARPLQVTIDSQHGDAADPAGDSQRRALLEQLLHMNIELRRLTTHTSGPALAAAPPPPDKVEALT